MPKTHRHSLGLRVDNLLIESVEAIAAATFLYREAKLPYVQQAIRKIDTTKILLLILWETNSLDTKKYAMLSVQIEEVGRMLGGWHGQLIKNSLAEKAKEK